MVTISLLIPPHFILIYSFSYSEMGRTNSYPISGQSIAGKCTNVLFATSGTPCVSASSSLWCGFQRGETSSENLNTAWTAWPRVTRYETATRRTSAVNVVTNITPCCTLNRRETFGQMCMVDWHCPAEKRAHPGSWFRAEPLRILHRSGTTDDQIVNIDHHSNNDHNRHINPSVGSRAITPKPTPVAATVSPRVSIFEAW